MHTLSKYISNWRMWDPEMDQLLLPIFLNSLIFAHLIHFIYWYFITCCLLCCYDPRKPGLMYAILLARLLKLSSPEVSVASIFSPMARRNLALSTQCLRIICCITRGIETLGTSDDNGRYDDSTLGGDGLWGVAAVSDIIETCSVDGSNCASDFIIFPFANVTL